MGSTNSSENINDSDYHILQYMTTYGKFTKQYYNIIRGMQSQNLTIKEISQEECQLSQELIQGCLPIYEFENKILQEQIGHEPSEDMAYFRQNEHKILVASLKELEKWQLNFGFRKSQTSSQRQKNCKQIFIHLFFGYSQLLHQVKICKQIDPNSVIVQDYQKMESKFAMNGGIKDFLLLKAKSIQEKVFQFQNRNSQEKIYRKYKFHILNLVKNLSDFENFQLRRNIILGAYPPKFVAIMDQKDMLPPFKKQDILTQRRAGKTKFALMISEKRQRQQKYWKKILKNKEEDKKNQSKSVQKILQHQTIKFFLSNKFVDQLQFQLMQIPRKQVRKSALLNLKRTLRI